ncbi:MAG: hypothetical protein QXH44_05105 [Pyrobaculum sp.]|jgi:hypothetical protein
MPQKYSRLAVERPLADEFSHKVRKTGRKPSEVIRAVLTAVIDAIDHGLDPVDMLHICRIARSIGPGRSGFENGQKAGVLLRAYYTPREFLEVLAKIGPQILGVYKVGPDMFRINDVQVKETIRGVLAGLGCGSEERQEFLIVKC